MLKSSDTIFAPATAPGKSGVAIVRLSGPAARPALEALSGHTDWQPYVARPVTLRAGDRIIDRGLALFFEGPKSFTGEDVAELHTHGSPAVLRELMEILSAIPGLRPAEPGEFTHRAFLNGKMDLVEAEGLADLIAAETPAQKAQALRQMGGDLSRYYDELRGRIVRALAHLEAYIDFPDEEIPESVWADVQTARDDIIALIETALADQKRGERLREGLPVVILGAPNVGKSSLLNALAGRDAAIVSERAGTTRDVIEVHLDLAGFPVILTDTAGLRESTDEIEEEGIRRARARAGEAALKLLLLDAGDLSNVDNVVKSLIDNNTLIVINKMDCHPERSEAQSRDIGAELRSLGYARDDIFYISAKTGKGIDALLKAIEARITPLFSDSRAPVITRARHRDQLTSTMAALRRFDPDAPLELACEEFRQAAQAIGKITGRIEVDELLDVVFKSFCIGK